MNTNTFTIRPETKGNLPHHRATAKIERLFGRIHAQSLLITPSTLPTFGQIYQDQQRQCWAVYYVDGPSGAVYVRPCMNNGEFIGMACQRVDASVWRSRNYQLVGTLTGLQVELIYCFASSLACGLGALAILATYLLV